ncbi:MAG TPA: LLM class flavin-dependent oxidoreductase [Chloroflexota bacterium]|nr:LLM class flavin-dependent oxidoreductase [Chloroflexota bacterium]
MEHAASPTVVRFGLSLPNRAVLFGLPVQTLFDETKLAEQSGLFDSVWVGDNFLSKPRVESIVTLSALAAVTQRVKLGVVCLATFPMRHPLPLALQWGSLDIISGGRTILAVSLGGPSRYGPRFATELATMGVTDRDRIPRLKEGIDCLRLLWADGLASYDGQFYKLKDVDLQPKPVQRRLPIIIASNPGPDPAIEERALRRVARYGDGWQTDGTAPEVFERRWRMVREFAAECGRPGAMLDSSLHLMVNINDDRTAARREAVEFLNHYYGEGNVSEEKLQSWLAIGPPTAVIDKIQRFVEAGCMTLILRFAAPDQLGQLERCVEEVLPAFEC